MANIEMQPVSSTAIAAIGYDEETQTLRVEFPRGKTAEYTGVPPDLWEKFQAADSKGRFFRDFVKGQFPWGYV